MLAKNEYYVENRPYFKGRVKDANERGATHYVRIIRELSIEKD